MFPPTSILCLSIAILVGPLTTPPETDGTIDQAWAAYRSGDVDQARTLAEKLASSPTEEPWAYVLLGQLASDEGGDGVDSFERAIELGGDDADIVATVADAWASKYGEVVFGDQSYLATDALQHAESLYERWSELDPASPLPLQRLAWLRKTGGDNEAAIGLLFAAVAKNPVAGQAHNDLWSNLGSSLSYRRLASFYEGLALGSYDSVLRAQCRDYQGQVVSAESDSQKIAARAAAERGDLSGAASLVEEAKRLNRQAIVCFRGTVEIDESYRNRAERNEAAQMVKICEAMGTTESLVGTRQDRSTPLPLSVKRAVADAREALDPLIRRDPNDASLQLEIDRLSGAIYEASGLEGGSREGMGLLCDLWSWATTMVPERTDWWNNLGFFGRESERYQESFEAYQRCVELDPGNVRSINDTGLILFYHLDRIDEAEQLFQRAIELGAQTYAAAAQQDPESEAFERAAWGDAMLNLGRLKTQQGEFDEARRIFDRLHDLDPNRIDLFTSRAVLAIEAGDTESLDATIERLATQLQERPDDRATRYILAEMHSSLKESSSLPQVDQFLARIERALAQPRTPESPSRNP